MCDKGNGWWRHASQGFTSTIHGEKKKMLTGAIKRIACAIFAFATIATPAYAADYHIQTSKDQITAGFDNQGYWSPTLAVGNGYQEYMAGRVGADGTDRVRGYFTFSLGSIDFSKERVVSAALEIRRYGFPNRNDALEKVEFYDVSTPYLVLNTQEGISQSIYQDLGTGQRYGVVEIPNTGDGRDVVTVLLNNRALADITAAASGGYFSVGLSCFECTNGQVVFNNSGTDGLQRLTLVTELIPAAPVPEPAEWTMLIAGLLVVGFIARRRKGLRQ
jgi:hypothetical protein